MLYTRAGDDGSTRLFHHPNRISKASTISEALGTLDELNAWLGVCKVKKEAERITLRKSFDSAQDDNIIEGDEIKKTYHDILHSVQENLFIIQAEVAGATKSIDEEKVKSVEHMIDTIEKELPKITTFLIAGGSDLSASIDYARTLARRTERRVGAVKETEERPIGAHTLQYLNRLSSLLYALERYLNHQNNTPETPPHYT